MAKAAVTAQERLEKLMAGAKANSDGPALNSQQLQGFVDELNDLEAELGRAKLAVGAATQARNAKLKEALDVAVKAELAVKSHYGPKSPKVKEYVLSQSRPAKKSKGG